MNHMNIVQVAGAVVC